MAREFIDDLFNGGYIRAMQSLAVESGATHVRFSRDYADGYGVPIGAALLFGPRCGANAELLHFLAAERIHGMHRDGTSPHHRRSEEAKSIWYKAERIQNWPTVVNDQGQRVSLDITEEQGGLPEGVASALRDIWRHNRALRHYTGTNRLSGDIPYQIIEDVLDVLVQKRCSPLNDIQKAQYSQIVEDANKQGIEPFNAVYQSPSVDKDRLRLCWNKARRLLHDYSMLLWESQNQLWLAEGKRAPATRLNLCH